MLNYFTQTSLSRDFTLLAATVLFVVLGISAWFTYSTYSYYSARITQQLQKESERIETTLAGEIEKAGYLLTALGKQITLNDAGDLPKLEKLLKTFNTKDHIYTLFSWVDIDKRIVVSSNRGILQEPVDVSDRDYVVKAAMTPWKVQIGRPVEGRVSDRWVIPVTMGITDYTGHYAGMIMVSIDINLLTEQLSQLVQRDGISFAIISKTLIPLTQVSDDKDFVKNNFPADTLMDVNFTTHPNGLIREGSLFWGKGNYSYYKVSANYPYIILLGFDSFYNNATTRDILFSRLLQVFVVGVFLIGVLWIMRVRMIKPIIEMTGYAASVAKGKPMEFRHIKGPVEINMLAREVFRINEYINETKRIEDELRNKVFMLKHAKEQAQIDRRSKSEFLAYACQEMRTALNNIVGFAQVMRDQLYGPIENRKYRQYSADIYQTGNNLLNNMQDLLTFSKLETGYTDLLEEPQDIAMLVNKVLRFVSDKLQKQQLSIRLNMQDPLPKLMADEFRLQQILMNVILYALEQSTPERLLTLETVQITEGKDNSFFVFTINNTGRTASPPADLLQIVAALREKRYTRKQPGEERLEDRPGLGMELARGLVEMHQGYMDVQQMENGDLTILLFFPASRLV
ncbi:MAG: histidine kinase dimerization/phospho-acceptor domain-containing protein [Alphaproteobacteria bacterium]